MNTDHKIQQIVRRAETFGIRQFVLAATVKPGEVVVQFNDISPVGAIGLLNASLMQAFELIRANRNSSQDIREACTELMKEMGVAYGKFEKAAGKEKEHVHKPQK